MIASKHLSFSPFRPPFAGLAPLVWLLAIGIYLLWPNSLARRGDLFDSDDYMYLAQTVDWLNGQGWYDNIQHRLNPPDGYFIHYSRFAELTFAILIFGLTHLGVATVQAAILVALCWPPLLLIGFFRALRWTALSLLPTDWACLTAIWVLTSTSLIAKFFPGHLDHHGLMQITMVLALGCILRLLAQPASWKYAVIAGALVAFGQVIALETLPWLLLFTGALAISAVVQGGAMARASAIYATTLFTVSLLFLLASFPSAGWRTVNPLSFSYVYVLLTAGIAVTCIGIAFADETKSQIIRWIVGVSLAAMAAIGFLLKFPELSVGPFAAMDPAVSRFYMANIAEARPLTIIAPAWYGPPLLMIMPIIGLAAAIKFWSETKGGSRWCWALLAALIATALILTIFYQVRFDSYAESFAILPLVALLRRIWLYLENAGKPRLTRWGRRTAGLIVILGIITLSIQIGVMHRIYGIHSLAARLNDPQTYGDHPRFIINMMNDGAELLLRTRHNVLAAPYNYIGGTQDYLNFFLTTDPAKAEAIARAHHADLVLLNRDLPQTLVAPKPVDVDDITPSSSMSFARQLAFGIVPPWLKAVPIPEAPDYWLFEVLPPQPAAPDTRP